MRIEVPGRDPILAVLNVASTRIVGVIAMAAQSLWHEMERGLLLFDVY